MKDETKTDRILWLYDALRAGRSIDRAAWAAEHQVCERSVRRDLNTIQRYLYEKENGNPETSALIRREGAGRYAIQNVASGFLSEGELLAICKILIESRAFTKAEIRSLLDRLLQSVMSDEGKKQIQGYIANELFNYLDPEHRPLDTALLWTAARAVETHHILSFSYCKIGSDTPVSHRIRPVGILFSEYYFYVMGIGDSETGEAEFKKSGPRTYRLDRMENLTDTEDTFSLPYSERFKEGEFKNRVQFMYGGEAYTITFNYYGPSVEAVLDRLPTAEIIRETAERKTLRAEVAGPGILMWLLSQGSMIEVLSPARLRERWLAEVRKILERAGEKV